MANSRTENRQSVDIHWLLLRIRRDYLFAPRHEEYRQILTVAAERQYQTMSLLEFYSRRAELAGQKVLALRHDVDTYNRKGVRLFFDLEREFGVSATYYFRLKTFGMAGMVTEILEYGSEVGYHFEEPATLAKRSRITSCRELQDDANRRRIDQMMTRNIQSINTKLGIQIQSLCSHNDFYNRRLGVENHAFLSDQVRQRFSILFEAYDPSFKGSFDECISDVTDNAWLWHGDRSPVQSMLEGVPRLYVLTHPRQWHPAPIANTRENAKRLFQELYYRSLGL
jgi:hypothetical protein